MHRGQCCFFLLFSVSYVAYCLFLFCRVKSMLIFFILFFSETSISGSFAKSLPFTLKIYWWIHICMLMYLFLWLFSWWFFLYFFFLLQRWFAGTAQLCNHLYGMINCWCILSIGSGHWILECWFSKVCAHAQFYSLFGRNIFIEVCFPISKTITFFNLFSSKI